MFPDKNYTLGSGELYFAPFAPDTRVPAEGQGYFGNTIEINLATESETLDHFDTDHGIRTKDDSVLLEKNMSGSFITDHISPTNLAKWFTGTSSVVAQVSALAQVEAFTDVKRGVRYQLGVTLVNPSGLRGLATMSAVMGATPLVEDVDIRFDAETGSFLILPTSLVVTDDEQDVTVTYDVTATTFNRVTAGNEANLEGELFYKSFNGKGVKFDYFFPYVQLAPDGDFALKGDDWQQLGFTFQALQRDNNTAIAYTNGRPGVAV
jgi:hypothetical protein